MKNSKRTPGRTGITQDDDEARRLLEGLREQQTELGDVAEELVKLLLDAGVTLPARDGAAKRAPD